MRWKGETELSTFAMTRCVISNKPSTNISCMAVMLITEKDNNNIFFRTEIKNIYMVKSHEDAYWPDNLSLFTVNCEHY